MEDLNIVIPELGEDKDVEIKTEKEQFSLKDLINVIIAFINKLIRFEF